MGASYQKHAAKRQQKSLGQENTPDASPKSADDTTLAAPSPSPSSSYPPAQFKDYGHHGDEMLYATDLEDYGAETLEYLKEVEQHSIPMHNYMEYQQEINWKMRRTLIEWLIEVHLEYDLRPETLFLGVNIMDRYLSRRVVPKLEFQLLGVTALWLAAKYEEIHGKVPSLQKLSYVCCNAYREQDFVQMELRLLNELGFSLGHPTAETFLKHHCAMLKAQAEQVGADPTENIALARYLMELTLVHKRFMSARPSVIALASFLLADRLTGKCTWACQDELLLYMVDEIQDCIPNASRTIYEKYSKPRYSNASMLAKHYLQQGLQSSARGVQVPPPSIHTGFSKPSNPYPSPPSRFGDSRSASTETLVDQCWTSPSVAAHKQQQQHQPAMVMQQIAFVPTSTVVYSVGYLQPQVPVSDPMWRV